MVSLVSKIKPEAHVAHRRWCRVFSGGSQKVVQRFLRCLAVGGVEVIHYWAA